MINFNYDFNIAGHDFFLSRNRHGAGFFDRNLSYKNISQSVCNKLQAEAEKFKEINLFIKDEQIYFE